MNYNKEQYYQQCGISGCECTVTKFSIFDDFEFESKFNDKVNEEKWRKDKERFFLYMKTYPENSTNGWKYKLKAIWRVLTRGEHDFDEVIMNYEQIKDLKSYLNNIISKMDKKYKAKSKNDENKFKDFYIPRRK